MHRFVKILIQSKVFNEIKITVFSKIKTKTYAFHSLETKEIRCSKWRKSLTLVLLVQY